MTKNTVNKNILMHKKQKMFMRMEQNTDIHDEENILMLAHSTDVQLACYKSPVSEYESSSLVF